jgi:hypothetical protein
MELRKTKKNNYYYIEIANIVKLYSQISKGIRDILFKFNIQCSQKHVDLNVYATYAVYNIIKINNISDSNF